MSGNAAGARGRGQCVRYRADIDGLRALAVLPVLLFHLGVPAFSGGFVGVDVFFVISGFLITSIILPDIDAGRFSILAFYERRCRRLFPALFVVFTFSTLAGIVLMMPYELKKFAESLAASVLFFSNIVFALQTGYFDSAAQTKPLLHTWSLAVEEQFYIFYPLILLTLHRYAPRFVAVGVAVLALLSLGVSIEATESGRRGTYFLLHTRAFELLIGALIVVVPLPRANNGTLRAALSVAGLGLIGWAVFRFTPATPFPGAAALVPSLGTGLLIFAGLAGDGWVQRCVGAPPLVALGRISYPIYLWHWPLIVFTLMAIDRPLDGTDQAVLVLVTVLLSALTWKFVEQPVQRRRWWPTRPQLMKVAISGSAGLVIAGCTLSLLNGLPQRLPVEARIAEGYRLSRAAIWEQCPRPASLTRDVVSCAVGDLGRDRYDFAILGDSHAAAMAAAIGERARHFGLKGLVLLREGCAGLAGVFYSIQVNAHCEAFMDFAVGRIAEDGIKTVLLVSRWSLYADVDATQARGPDGQRLTAVAALREGFERTRRALPGTNFVALKTVPHFEYTPPAAVARAIYFGRPIPAGISAAQYERQETHAAEFLSALSAEGVTVLDPEPLLCPDGQCRLTRDRDLIYFDDDHVSRFGAKMLAPLFDPVLENLARSQAHSAAD